MKNLITYTLILFGFLEIHAQDAVVDFKGVRKNFIEAKQIGFEVEAYHYESKDDQGKLISKGIMRMSNGNYYSSFNGEKMVINKSKGTVTVDENSKEIRYINPQKKTKEPEMMAFPDSVFNQFKFLKKEEGLKKYEYVNKDPLTSIVKTWVYINNNYQLIKIVYFYNKNTNQEAYDAYKVVILYKNIITAGIENSYFNIDQYVIVKNNKPQLNKLYANYKLLN